MRRAILFFIKAGLIVAAAVWLTSRPGRVDIAWGGWIIETSAGFALLLLVLLGLVLAAVLSMVPAIRRALGHGRERRAARRRQAAYKALTGGMVAIAAGDGGRAAKQAARLDKNIDDKDFVHLLSAQAAQLRGDDEAARDGFEALAEVGDAKFLGQRGLIAMAMRAGELDAALAYAGVAYRQHPRAPWLLNILAELHARMGNWPAAQAVLEEALRRGLLPPAAARPMLAVVLEARAEEVEQAGGTREALALAKRAHGFDPRLTPAAARVARLELAANHPRRVRKLIEGVWMQGRPHGELAGLYTQAAGAKDAISRFQVLEGLHALNSGNRESAVILAEAAVDAKLWGSARAQLEHLAKDRPSARVVRLMARLAAEDGSADADPEIWLDRLAEASADPGWVCGQCGATRENWRPVCQACHTVGRIGWEDRRWADGEVSDLIETSATAPVPVPTDLITGG